MFLVHLPIFALFFCFYFHYFCLPLGVLPNLINLKQIKDKVSWATTIGNTYIGRKNKLLDSIWGNPFKLYKNDPLSRLKCVLSYMVYVTHSDLFFKIHQLCNTNMGCWCSPEICHGDVLTFLIDNSVIYCR